LYQTYEARLNPFAAPANGYDPPLGRPGILTSQAASGRLSLQRLIASESNSKAALFDEVFGHGWILLSMQPDFSQASLDAEAHDFFINRLAGKCISITARQDLTGEYSSWFAEEMQVGHVVLIRPDFYVFGHCSSTEASSLVKELGRELGAL
jgi:predicted short-subunit dehydrogenase-like oxidoreductase (DUF2520 family)